jgi:hypothetical protein
MADDSDWLHAPGSENINKGDLHGGTARLRILCQSQISFLRGFEKFLSQRPRRWVIAFGQNFLHRVYTSLEDTIGAE